jgi:drug/metabolite transporter (DMT)-like permease
LWYIIGLIVCTHFLAFYSSVKFGNSASITLACAGSVSFFSSVFEPFILKTAYSIRDIGLGLLVLVGILFIYISLPKAASNDLTNRYDLAIASGIISSILAALFTVLNKKYATLASPLVVSAIEMSAGAIFLSVLVPSVYQSKTIWFPSIDISHASEPGSLDLIWILILSILCTNLTFYLSMNSLNYVSGFTATLIFNLEPVYGIILGALIFHENKHLNVSFYIGTCIILLSIFINPLLALLYADECGDDREKSQGMIISLQRGLMKVRKEYVQVNVNDDDRDCEKFHQRQSSSRMEVEATI